MRCIINEVTKVIYVTDKFLSYRSLGKIYELLLIIFFSALSCQEILRVLNEIWLNKKKSCWGLIRPELSSAWWCHEMETLSALLALWEGIPSVTNHGFHTFSEREFKDILRTFQGQNYIFQALFKENFPFSRQVEKSSTFQDNIQIQALFKVCGNHANTSTSYVSARPQSVIISVVTF